MPINLLTSNELFNYQFYLDLYTFLGLSLVYIIYSYDFPVIYNPKNNRPLPYISFTAI